MKACEAVVASPAPEALGPQILGWRTFPPSSYDGNVRRFAGGGAVGGGDIGIVVA